MDGSSGSLNAVSSFCPSLAAYEIRVYLRVHGDSLDARRVQEMLGQGDSRFVYNAWNSINFDTQVGAWIKLRS